MTHRVFGGVLLLVVLGRRLAAYRSIQAAAVQRKESCWSV